MTEPNEPEDVQIPSYEELVEQRNRPRSPHHALKLAVRAGEITPKQAEEKAREQGLPLWHDGWEGLHDITTNSVWWLPQAVLFLAWRDLRQAREQWERYEIWGRDLWRDPCIYPQTYSLQEAEKELIADLRIGIFRAFGIDENGVAKAIPCQEWEYLSICFDDGYGAIDKDGFLHYSTIFILRHEIVPFLILDNLDSDISPVKELSRERGGQPSPKKLGAAQKYDWPAAAGFAAAYGHHYGYPEFQSIFAERIGRWFRTKGKVPDPRDLERFVTALYEGVHQKPDE